METVIEEDGIDTKSNIIEKNKNENYSMVKSMVNIMKTNLSDKGYKLTQEQMNWIQDYIEINPDFFTEINDDMIDLIDDKHIDLHEIPLLIKIFVKIFQNQDIKLKINNPKNIIAFIKYCFKIFIDYNFLVTNDVENNIVEAIIDNSLDLLVLNLMPIEEEVEEYCVCFSDFFRK